MNYRTQNEVIKDLVQQENNKAKIARPTDAIPIKEINKYIKDIYNKKLLSNYMRQNYSQQR